MTVELQLPLITARIHCVFLILETESTAWKNTGVAGELRLGPIKSNKTIPALYFSLLFFRHNCAKMTLYLGSYHDPLFKWLKLCRNP